MINRLIKEKLQRVSVRKFGSKNKYIRKLFHPERKRLRQVVNITKGKDGVKVGQIRIVEDGIVKGYIDFEIGLGKRIERIFSTKFTKTKINTDSIYLRHTSMELTQPDIKNEGFFTQGLSELEHIARKNGIKNIYLEVNSINKNAILKYQHLGFKKIDTMTYTTERELNRIEIDNKPIQISPLEKAADILMAKPI